MRTYLLNYRLVFTLLVATICTNCSSQNPVNASYSITPAEIAADLNFLASDDLKGRRTGSEGIDKAASYAEHLFDKIGVQPLFESYRDTFEVRGLSGFNIVGVLEGNDPTLKNEYLMIGAHYDHIGVIAPVDGDSIANGANDNAAGSVAVLNLARKFSAEKANGRSVIFALFSAEEMGLKGAAHLAKKIKQKNIDVYALVNFEMIGVPMKAKEYTAYLTGYEMSNMGEKINEYAGSSVLGFLPQAEQMNLFRRSDNYAFFTELNIPSQTVSTFDFSNYQYYHHVEDEASLMDADHMASLLNKIYPGLLKMTQTSEQEIKLNEQ